MTNRFITALVVASTAAVAQADLLPFNFAATPQQEVPANNSNAAGAGQLLYNTTTQTFDLDVQVFGIAIPDITGYHLHNAPVGVNGPVVINLVPLGNWSVNGLGIRLSLTNVPIGAQEANLFAQNLYFNLHSTAFPGGQIRGQIIPAPAGVGLLAAAGLFGARRRRR